MHASLPSASITGVPLARDPSGERVILLEFLTTDRLDQDGSISFPFLSGLARDLGVPCRWICFGYDPALQRPDRFSVGLDACDTEGVCEVVRAHGATVVVVSAGITTDLRRAIASALPGVRVVSLVGRTPWPSREMVADLLGLDPGGGGQGRWHLQDVAQPGYRCELLNPLARTVRPFVYVSTGPECVYSRPLSRNPVFAPLAAKGVDLGNACSFCVRGEPRGMLSTPPVTLIVRQIRAAARELPRERRSNTYVVRGIPLFFRLRAFADALLAEPLAPSTFLFSARADEVLRMAPVLDEVLPRLARAGHAVHVASLGAENFSDSENQRFNKGITTAQLEQLVAHIRRWESEWPRAFSFFAHGGFGHITFTPWTSLDDLEQNFAAMVRMGLEFGALFMGSRALLREGTPLALLAARDGLIAERFEDEAMARVVLAGCLKNAEEREIPWRFAHREVATIYSTILRALPQLAAFIQDDPSAPRVRELVARIAAGSGLDGFQNRELALAMLRVARRTQAPRSPEELLAGVLEDVAASASALREPFRVTAADVCNNRCLFCMEGEAAQPHVEDERVRELLRAHASDGYVMFTSGEPTLNPHLPQYVRWARECGYRRIGLTTNGRRLGYEGYARRLLDEGLNRVVVSIHGPDARTHDAQTRTPGSFLQTIAGLESLARLRGEYALTVQTKTVVSTRNVRRLTDIYWLVRSIAVDQCVFQVIQPLGRARRLARSLVARYSDVTQEFARLVRAYGDGRPPAFLVDVPRCAKPRVGPGREWLKSIVFTGLPSEPQKQIDGELSSRVKRAGCRECAYDLECPGIWESYVEAYGWGELIPVPRDGVRGSGRSDE